MSAPVAPPTAHANLDRLGAYQGDEDNRGGDDEDESRGRSGRYRVVATCDNGTLVSAMLNGVAVANGQTVLLKFDDKKTEATHTPKGLLIVRGSSFTLVVVCTNTVGATASDTFRIARSGKSDHGDKGTVDQGDNNRSGDRANGVAAARADCAAGERGFEPLIG